MFGLLALVSTVLGSIRVSLVVRHRSMISGYLLVDDYDDRHIDQSCLGVSEEVEVEQLIQSCLGVSDCKGPKKEVEVVLQSCGRTCWLIIADKIYARSL